MLLAVAVGLCCLCVSAPSWSPLSPHPCRPARPGPQAQEDAALQPSPLAPLHNHRRVLGVIGVMHCPHVQDVAKAYAQFEQRCK